MAIKTSVSIQGTDGGFASIIGGAQEGNRGREVTFQAYPEKGYVFDGWDVAEVPVSLEVFAVVANSPVPSIDAVCGTPEAPSSYQNISEPLFTDGTTLYQDIQGRIIAPSGYYGAGGGSYYYWNGATVPVKTECPAQQRNPGSGGVPGNAGGANSEQQVGDTGLRGDGSIDKPVEIAQI